MKPQPTQPAASQRLLSLDALRGFDMLFIMGFAGLVTALCKLCPGEFSDWMTAQMGHADWNGFFHHDTIFPLFLFIAGISFPFLARQTARKRDERTKHLPESHPPRPDPRGAGIRLQRTVQARLRHAAPAERAGPDRSGVDVRGAAVRQFQRAHARRHRRRDPPRLRTAAAIRRRARRRRGRAADPRRQYRGLRRPDRHALAPAGRQGIRPRRVVEHPPGHRDGHAGHVHGRVRPPLRRADLRQPQDALDGRPGRSRC